MDWNLIKTFVAVAEHGSLSKAAAALHISQPTASRQMQALQEQVGVELFVRHGRGLDLSEQGATLYHVAREARHAMSRVEMSAQSIDEGVSGTVRLSAARVVADFVLPGVLKHVRRAHPEIALEIVAEDVMANLSYRDVDLAIRMAPPTTQSLFGKQVATASINLYATREYLRDHPPLTTLSGISSHTVVGYDAHLYALDAMRHAGVDASREDFVIRSDAQTFHVHAILSGLCMGAMQDAIAARYDTLVRLELGLQVMSLPVWLLTHEGMRRSARVRAVMEVLGEHLARFYEEP